MPRMSDDELKQKALDNIRNSEGYDSDELEGVREEALDYYYLREKIAPSSPGRSRHMSSDVADMVEAVTAQIMPAFEVDGVVEFEPESPEDVDQARTETDAVNYMVMEVNNGYYELQSAIRDALLLRNGVMKVWLDERSETETVTWNMTDEQMLALLEPPQGVEIDILESVDNGDGAYTVTARMTTTTRKLKVQSVDVANFGWALNHDSIYLQDVTHCHERCFFTRSELLEMGYDKKKVESIKAYSVDEKSDSTARNRSERYGDYYAPEPSQDILQVYECYSRIDRDGDGIGELLKICISDNVLLSVDPIEFIPYCAGTAYIQPHRFQGMGLFDKLKHTQDGKTFTMRQWIDNQNHANNSRIGVLESAVNMDDVVNSRPGGVVRMRSADAVVPFPYNDIGGSAYNLLDYFDKQRSERGGASLDMQTAEMQVAGHTAHGVERQMSSKEQQAALMTRNLAETLVAGIFKLTHTAMRLWMPDDMIIRARGQFADVQPSQWIQRERLNVKAGLSIAERTKKKGAIEQMLAFQTQLMQQGFNYLVNPEGVYNAMMDWAKAVGFDSPERYFIDPASEEGQAAAQQQAQAAQEQEAKTQQMQNMMIQMQAQVEEWKHDIDQSKLELDKYKHDTKIILDYYGINKDSESTEAKLVTDMVVKMGQENEPAEAGSADAA